MFLTEVQVPTPHQLVFQIYTTFAQNRCFYGQQRPNVGNNFYRIFSRIASKFLLGPILFILYINDLNKCLSTLKSIHFSHDTNLYLDINPPTDYTSLINYDLANIQT